MNIWAKGIDAREPKYGVRCEILVTLPLQGQLIVALKENCEGGNKGDNRTISFLDIVGIELSDNMTILCKTTHVGTNLKVSHE